MSDFNLDEFRNEIAEVCKKYEVTHVAFSGEHDSQLLGFVGAIQPETLHDLSKITENAARTYQACREILYRHFDRVASIKI